MSGRQLWLDAFYSGSLGFKSECGVVLLALDDLAGDGCHRLAALLVGFESSRLRVLDGTRVQCEIVLPQMASAMCTFSTEGSLPAIAIGAGSSLYVYKNLKPFYKYSLPNEGAEEAEIVALASLPRSPSEASSSCVLVVGTERSVVLVDSLTFNAVRKVAVDCAPSVIRCRGCFDVDASIVVGTRDGRAYHLRPHLAAGPQLVVASSQPVVDAAFTGNFVALATGNKAIKFYTVDGQEIRRIKLERLVVAVTSVEVRSQDASILAVSLADGSLLFYRQGALLERLHAASPVVAMASGRFGREDACLVMVTRDGDVAVKVLNRGFKLADPPEPVPTTPSPKSVLPAKTKLFVEQALREQEDPKLMHRKFREGMCRAHLRALQEWFKLSRAEHVDPGVGEHEDGRRVHLLARLAGASSRMILRLLVQNAEETALEGLAASVHPTRGELVVERPHFPLPLLLPFDQHELRVRVGDPSSRGGELAVVVFHQLGPTSRVVCSAKIDIAPAI